MTINFPTNNVSNDDKYALLGITVTTSTKEELMAKLESLAAQIAALG
jgi:hypothetical protein